MTAEAAYAAALFTAVALTAAAVAVRRHRYRPFAVGADPPVRDAAIGDLRDGVVVVDDRGRVVEANARARRLLGNDDVVGEPLADVPGHGAALAALVDGDRDRAELVVDGPTDGPVTDGGAHGVRGGFRADADADADPDDRGRQLVEVTVCRFADADDDRGYLLLLRGVAEDRHTEGAFRALVENSRDLVSVVAPDGTRTYCAPSFERVLDYEPADLVGRDAFELVHHEDRADARETFDALLAGEEGAQDRTEYRVRHADGSWRTFEAVRANLVADPSVGGVVVNARDVTSRRRYEQRLRVLNRVLRHDLRNETNVIQGHADLLLDERLTAEAKEHARVIRRKAGTLVELGEQTRKIDYTLHGTDGVEKPFEITAPIRERLDAIQREFPGALVSRGLPDEQWVLADDLVESALLNVVDNAIEHNDRVVPEVGVEVGHVTHDGVDYVEVAVADNGPGIPASERRVFEEGTETPLSHGSGLGLWLTQWIVTRSNGRLSFEENDPRGTVVRVWLRETRDRSAAVAESTPTSTSATESSSSSTDGASRDRLIE
jgi:PAS domain S-box-containing protein